jgi:hypothetical protein
MTMKKLACTALFFVLFFGLSSWSHKFYVGIFQVDHNAQKKMLQVTCRIFVDDLNSVLKKKYNRKFRLGEPDVSADDVSQMTRYINSNFSISVDGKPGTLEYRSYEMESNVVVSYFRIINIAKVKSLEIRNSVLFDLVPEQQNIIQATVNGTKQSLLLTADAPRGKLTF